MSGEWVAAMRAELPLLARDIETQIRAEIPEYAADRGGTVATNLRTAVTAALSAFVSGMSGQRAAVSRGLDPFRRIGALEAQAGRSHDTLQLAYRVATHHVAEHLASVALRLGTPPAQQAEIRHAAVAFVEQLAQLTRTAYDEASAAGAAVQQAVTRLVELLAQSGDLSRSAVLARAETAGWRVPERVRAIEFVPESAFDQQVVHRLQDPRPPDVREPTELPARTDLVVARLPGRCVGFTTTDIDLDQLAVRLPRDTAAVVGPEVALLDASRSARIALRAARRGATPAGVVRVDDHLLDLFGSDAADVMAALAIDRLRPLAQLGIVKRMKAAAVLSAMLECGGLAREAPELAGISASTWQYRKSIVEQLFGPALRDRDRRVELILALRWAVPRWESELAMHERRRRPAPRPATPNVPVRDEVSRRTDNLTPRATAKLVMEVQKADPDSAIRSKQSPEIQQVGPDDFPRGPASP